MAKQNKPNFLNRIEVVILNILSTLKTNVSDYCELETTEGRYNILLSNGSMMTIIAYDGTRTLVEQEVFYSFLNNLAAKLKVYLNKSGHQFGMVFRRDLNPTSDIYRIAEIQKNTAKSLQLDLDYLIDENVQSYARFVYDETNYIVLITNPTVLDSAELELESKRNGLIYKNHTIPGFASTQQAIFTSGYLKSQHETYVEAVLGAIKDGAFAGQARKMDVVDAVRAIKKSVSPLHTDENWMPQIPATTSAKNPILARLKTSKLPNDVGHLLWQPLPEQIMRSSITAADATGQYPTGAVLTENRIYTPLLISCPPQSFVDFNNLFISLNNASTKLSNGQERAIPFAVSFMLKGDGYSTLSLKKSLASILAVASVENAGIKGAIESLRDYKDQGGTVVSMSMSAMTWSENNTYGLDEIHLRRSKLWRVIESWGGAQVTEKGGDPILGFTSNCLALTDKHHAPMFCAPLFEALHFMPWCRQASPFSMGTIMNRSADGKLMKMEAFSSELSTWIKLYVGRPGTGKSVAMNNDIIEACLMAGLKRLPFIFMVDVGISSRGCVNFIRGHLPDNLKHLAVYRRLKNDVRYSINPLDIAVGRMKPSSDEMTGIVSFLSTLVTPVEANGQAEKGLSNFLTMLIEQTFIAKMENTEKGKPNLYERYHNPELDSLLVDLDIDAQGRSYYELVDILHDLGAYRARDLSHRYSMPKLSDMIATASSNPEIIARYQNALTESGESIIDMFIRNISEAITMYEVFSDHTKFDVDTARIISLDLQDVIGKNPKQSSLFFQIARMCGKRRIAFHEDDVELFPPRFQAYYKRLCEEIAEDPKIFSYDELHNAKKDKGLFSELVRDCREARKWNLMLKFASQLMSDFDEIPSLATQFMIADRGTQDTRAYTQKAVSLSNFEVEALARYPSLGPSGLMYFSKNNTKSGSFVSICISTIPPMRMWALTTDSNDRNLKDSVIELVGTEREANILLADQYPGGARKAMNERKEMLRDNDPTGGSASAEDEMNSIAKIMAQEIYSRRSAILSKWEGKVAF